MKDRLTKEESAHLINLGVPKEKASIKYIEEIRIVNNHEVYDWAWQFTLTDLLEILPKKIEIDEGCKDTLVIDFIDDSVYVQYTFQSRTRQESEELIDALYELCVWCLGNKYLKF